MKKKLRRTLAIMLALFLTGHAFAEHYVSARADNEEGNIVVPPGHMETDTPGFTISNFDIKLNGESLTDGADIYAGEEVELYFEWEIDNNLRADQDYDSQNFSREFTIDASKIDCEGLNIQEMNVGSSTDRLPLYAKNYVDQIGYYYMENGIIHIVIENGYFYQNTQYRVGGVKFKGTIEESKNPADDGSEKNIQFGDHSVLTDYYLTNTESSAGVTKERKGDIEVSTDANGVKKYYQTYTVTVKANNGTVKEITLTDEAKPVDGLKNPSNVKITASTVSGVPAGDYPSLDAVWEAISKATFYMDEYVTLEYTMEVSADIFKSDANGYQNTVKGTYISNRSQEPKDVQTEAQIWVNKPSISKTLEQYEVRTEDGEKKGYVKWKITIQLNDIYEDDRKALEQYIRSIVDTPDNKFKDFNKEIFLDPKNFKSTGNPGEYYIEFEQEVTKDVLNSTAQEQVTNYVKMVTTDGNEYDCRGSGTIENPESTEISIEKTIEKKERTKEGLLVDWIITVSDIPGGIKDFTISDDSRHYNNNPGNQKLLTKIWLSDSIEGKYVLIVDGIADYKGNLTDEGAKIINEVTNLNSEQYFTIAFKDDYIEKITAQGQDGYISIKVQTLITEDTIGREYGNGATVTFKDAKTSSPKSASTRETFHDTENLLVKDGEVVDGKNAISYTIKVLVPFLEINEIGKSFTIKDTITNTPDNGVKLIVDEGSISVKLTDQWNNVKLQGNQIQYTTDVQGQDLSLTITTTKEFIENIKGNEYNGSAEGYYLVVNYTASVEDPVEFTRDGKTETFTNEASGEYNDNSIGSDSVENKLTPVKAVNKTAEYNEDTAPYAKYTVHVNREGLTLLGGGATLQAKDTLGSALQFVDADDFTTGENAVERQEKYRVKVYEGDSNTLLTSGEFSYEISSDKHELTFSKLPDGKHLRIEYWAYVQPNTQLNADNSSNDFELTGFSSDAVKDGTHFNILSYETGGWAGSRIGSIILYKYWTNNGNMEALSGSKFRLVKMRIDEDGKIVEDDRDGDPLLMDDIEITSNDGRIRIDNLPVNQLFALYEIKAPDGFVLREDPYYFVVEGTTAFEIPPGYENQIDIFVTGAILKYENEPADLGWIKIAKTWEEKDTTVLSWEAIKDSLTFEIKNAQGVTIETLTGADLTNEVALDGTIRHVSEEIPVTFGSYTVVETNTAVGNFDVETTYVIEAGGNTAGSGQATKKGEIVLSAATEGVTVVYHNSYIGTFPVKISKQAVGGQGEEIAGAGFKLIKLIDSSKKEVVKQWNSGSEPYEIDLVPGTYTLQETSAPQGYKIAQDITFIVDSNGKVTVGGNEVTDETVVMRDEPLSLQVDKVLAGENTVISGVTLTLYDKSHLGSDGNLRPDVKGNLLPEDDGPPTWKSGGSSWQIGKYLYAGTNRTYVLVETKAPAGYNYSKNIEFKVEGDGGIIILSGDGHIDAATDSKILMEDKAISIKLSKLTLAGTELEGATIGLYKASDLDDDGRPKDDTSPIGDTWESGSEPFDFAADRLEAGGQYALVEINPPSGDYALAESIYFNVDKYGNIDVLGVAGMDLGGTPEEPVIKMYDLTKEQQAERATLVLRKTIGGVLDINAPDILDKIGDLTFTVTGPIEEESSDRVYTIKDFLPPTPTRKSYELTIPNLTPGTYTVTESGYDINGMNCTTTYTIEAVEESGELSPMGGGTAVVTEGIELQGGHEVIVSYNNNYADKMGKILLAKSYESSGNALDWADISRNLTFRIYEVTDAGIKKEIGKSPISGTSLKWTRRNNENTYEYVIDVKTGKYIIEEIYTTIAGYNRTTSYRVTADGDTPADFTSGNAIPVNNAFEVKEGETTAVEFVNKYVRNYPISISKRDINGTEELEGATLTVSGTPNDGSTFKTVTWTSGKQGTDSSGKLKPYELLLKPGMYILTETIAPRGYALAQEAVKFEIKDNGEISITVDETKGAVDGNTLIMKDAPLDIQVSKVDITGANEVKDATLVVYLAKDVENGRPKANSTPVIEPWVSADTGQPKDIGSYLEVGETYVLIETGAPKGYAYSESIEFTVNADGSITTDNTAKYQGDTVHTDPLETTKGNRILMRDEAISIKLNKVELGNTTKELEGAVIGIYDADAVDADGRLINSDTRPLEAWKSEIGGCHEFGAELEAGHDYVFVETATPDGYQFATSIRFTIKEDGSVANVSTVTGETINPTRDAVYLMEDDINTDPRATLVLTKSIEGEGIRPTDITKTNLRFHVESVDLSPAYDRVFYVGSAGFEWDSTESMYIQHIYNLTPGKYKVTELWDDSTASGVVCTGQTWEIVPAGASVTGPPSGTGVTTGEINLEDGDTIVVNYTNTYDPPKDPPAKLPDEDPDDPPDETEGTLIITKTIAGDATKEEVEGTLTFTVTENSTGKKAVYTLKDDFKYNSETKQWTKKLVLTAGGYTVEESGNALDGKTCTTRYTVTGGTSRNGVGTQVTNVVVEQGGTTTVAYTNTYIVNPPNKGDNDDGDSPELLEKVSNVVNSLTKTGDGAPIAAWLLLLLFGVAEAIDAGYALSHRKKKDGTNSLE